jgi:hypothetical protein
MEINALALPVSEAPTLILQSGATYTLTIKGTGEESALAGDLDIRQPMNIRNSGTGNATVRGGDNWSDRIFHIWASEVLIDGVNVQNGHADLGGGILLQNGFLAFENSTIGGNFASKGGGIATTIFSEALTLNSSTVSGNTAIKANGIAGLGGGIWNSGADVCLINSTISGNKATGYGGGIFNDSGPLVANNVTIANNVADSDGDGTGDGGVPKAGGCAAARV